MLTLEQKRELDAHLTAGFLGNATNGLIITRLIDRFIAEMAAIPIGGYHFYLKGGNALAILANNQPTGDYDFQLVPPRAEYANWYAGFNRADDGLIGALIRSVRDGIPAGTRLNDTMFEVNNLSVWAAANGIPFEGVMQGPRRKGILHIGPEYGWKTYAQIVTDPKYVDNRLTIDKGSIMSQKLENDRGPMIYINYTIPGFILYRVVYSFVYYYEDGTPFSLKSEIIDVSIPRKGSEGVYTSSNNVITCFRNTLRGYRIPGWSYHFFENINLLQRIKLGMNWGSHKEQKRWERTAAAMTELKTIAENRELYQPTYYEPFPAAASNQILGYLGAFGFPADDYREVHGRALYYTDAIEEIKLKIIAEIARLFKLFRKTKPTAKPGEWFVMFRLGKVFEAGCKNAKEVKEGFYGFIRGYNNKYDSPFLAERFPLTKGHTYQLISPLDEVPNKSVFPLDFIVAEVGRREFAKLKAYYNSGDVCAADRIYGDDAAVAVTIHCTHCVIYVLFQSCDRVSEQPEPHLEYILERCVLESQRYALSKLLEAKREALTENTSKPEPKPALSAPSIGELFSILQNKAASWKLSDNFPNLPSYAVEDGSDHPFLSGLELFNLKLPPAPFGESLTFSAEMDNSAPFLKETLCADYLEPRFTVEVNILDEGSGELRVNVSRRFEGAKLILPCMELSLDSFAFSSGTGTGPKETANPPAFSYGAALQNDNPLKLCVFSTPGLDSVSVLGDYSGQKALSIDEILDIFKIGGFSLIFRGLLPKGLDAGLFDSLTLERVRFDASGGTVDTAEFNIISNKSWAITGDISVIPGITLQILNPFEEKDCSISLNIASEWKLGGTTYQINADPFRWLASITLKEGDTLNFAAISKLYLDMPLPDVKIDQLCTLIDVKNSSFLFCLGASGSWGFSILGKQFAVERAGVKIWHEHNATSVVLEGEILFLDIPLGISCEFFGSSKYRLSAYEIKPINLKLLSFLSEFCSAGAVSAYVPEGFMDFNISGLRLSYEKDGEDWGFEFHAQIDRILSITDSFKIDKFYIETLRKTDKTETIKLLAEFCIAGCALRLEVSKDKDGMKISGGTPGVFEIPVATLLSEFIGDVLHYNVVLPQALNSFVIRSAAFSYLDTKDASSFSFDCEAAFGGKDSVLAKLFGIDTCVSVAGVKKNGVWEYGFSISCEIELAGSQIVTCSYVYDKTKPEAQNRVALSYKPKNPGQEIPLSDILSCFGINGVDPSWTFLTQTGVTRAEIAYDFVKMKLHTALEVTGGSGLEADFTLGGEFEYKVVLISTASVSLTDIPIAGSMVAEFAPSAKNFSISDVRFYALSHLYATKELPAGVRLALKVCGEEKSAQIYEMKPKEAFAVLEETTESSGGAPPKTFWLNIEKTVAIFTLHRAGFSLDGGELSILLDAGLSVSPLTFEMLGLGVSANIQDFSGVSFHLSGFGVSFESESLSISGSLMKTESESDAVIYGGSLSITAGNLSIFAVGQYSDGSLMAYACLNTPLGGPPAFFVKGIAAGFGYNQNLTLPDINSVKDYPLIHGAKGGTSLSDLPAKLAKYITPSRGQNFLAAGVRFTSFEIADSFALVTVAFGKKLQIGVLGLSDINMPPNCETNPIAHAQLALRAALLPDDGLLSVEAVLTTESYVLSKDCKLTGGFAFFLWFGGIHEGDFVITLGGYHPSYKKPDHYPSVPRLGFRWDVIPDKPNRLVISGELYFALTPSQMMAGGRLSAIYSHGNLRAWFILRADFLIQWKPFHYDIQAGISIGASYTLDLWLVKQTFTIELSCDLHIWGPEFTGIAHVTWFIISFDIEFGAGASQNPGTIDWADFSKSFLPAEAAAPKPAKAPEASAESANNSVNPLSISFSAGVADKKGEAEAPIIRPEELELSITTVFPCTAVTVKGSETKDFSESGRSVYVRPMGKYVNNSALIAKIVPIDASGKEGEPVGVKAKAVERSVPSALWGSPGEKGELVDGTVCGVSLLAEPKTSEFFPKDSWISETLLSDANPIERLNAFDFSKGWKLPTYKTEETLTVFAGTAAKALKENGESFLKTMGYDGVCEIARFAADAETLLDEDIFAGEVGGLV